jgi:hypothetical protein
VGWTVAAKTAATTRRALKSLRQPERISSKEIPTLLKRSLLRLMDLERDSSIEKDAPARNQDVLKVIANAFSLVLIALNGASALAAQTALVESRRNNLIYQ